MDASDDGNLIAACASIVEVVVDMKHCTRSYLLILFLSSVLCWTIEFIYSHTRLSKCCIFEWCCINHIDDNNFTGIPFVYWFIPFLQIILFCNRLLAPVISFLKWRRATIDSELEESCYSISRRASIDSELEESCYSISHEYSRPYSSVHFAVYHINSRHYYDMNLYWFSAQDW